jgi:LysM repeat protein
LSRIISFFLLAALFFLPSCSGASDEEIERLKAETEALAEELGELRRESEILDKALTNVYREKDMIVDRLNSLSGEGGPPQNLAGMPIYPAISGTIAEDGTVVPNQVESLPPAPKSYKVKKGDTLSQIAGANNTTIQALLALNPFLLKRPGNMVWEEDEIILSE